MQSAYYLTICECPLIAWEKRYKGKGLNNAAIRKEGAKFNYTEESDYEAWDVLFIDWQQRVKQSPDFLDYQSNIKQYNNLMLRYLKSVAKKNGCTIRDRSILNEIRRVEGAILKYEKNVGKGETINQTLQKISKNQGYHLSKKDLTVEDYFDLIDLNTTKTKRNG